MRRFLAALVLAAALGCEHKGGDNVPLDKVPEPVMKTAREVLPDVAFEQAWKTLDGNYEVRGRGPGGRIRDVQVKPTGEKVEVD